MAYYLNFVYSAAGDKYFNCNIPASTSSAGRPLQIEWEIEFEAKKNVDQFIVASLSSAGAANLLFLQSGTNFEFRSEGNANWVVTTGVTLTNFNVFKIRSTFDGTTRVQTLHINGNLIATRNPATANVGAFGVIVGLNSSAIRGGSLKYLKYTDFVTPANNRLYDANLSNGTGTILPESLYGLNATQGGIWPADNSEWVFYEDGGGSISATISATMPQMQVAGSASVTNPAIGAAIAFTMPQMQVATAGSVVAPVVSAAIAFNMPQMSVSASAAASAPTVTAAVALTMPQMTVAVSGNVVAVGNSASVSFTMPQMTIAASGGQTAPAFASTIATIMPQMQVACSADVQAVAGISANIALTMPQMLVSAGASTTAPVISASISFTMPQMSVYVLSGEFDYYGGAGSHIEYAAESARIETLAASTYIEYTL